MDTQPRTATQGAVLAARSALSSFGTCRTRLAKKRMLSHEYHMLGHCRGDGELENDESCCEGDALNAYPP
jgi:hypothetical protein